MVKAWGVLLLLLLIGYPANATTPVILPFDKTYNYKLNIHPTIKATFRIKKGRFQITVPGGETQTLTTVEPYRENKIYFQVHDFNFDGYIDIAIAQSYGYGGVNVFSDLYLFDLNQKNYMKVLNDSNFEVDHNRHILMSGQKSGPRYYQKEYKFEGLTPRVIWDSVTLAISGLWKVKFYDHKGEVKKVVITNSLKKLEPARLKIALKKAYLHQAPYQGSKGKSYVIQGDSVQLLDVDGSWDEWVKILYNNPSKGPVKGWVKANAFSESY